MMLLLFVLLVAATPADAGVVGTAVSAVATWFTGSTVGAAVGRVLVGAVLNSFLASRQRLPEASAGPIQQTLTGGANGDGFILGRYATAGTFVGPPLAHGDANKFGTYVIDLGLAGATVNRIFVDGEPYTPSATTHADYGAELILNNQGDAKAWAKTYDGSQTTADAMLVAKYGSDPDFPWSSSMVGQGRSYAILTFKRAPKVFSGAPRVLFEVDGIPLYDVRKDSTAGGSGPHRWDTSSTWEQTNNPIVMVYNILRGVTLPDGSVWGAEVEAADLPVSTWAAAMNACDELAWADGEQEARYRAGLEVNVAELTAKDVIDELLAACDGEIAEEGGVWYVRVGEPDLPVWTFTDDDISVSEPEEFEPFPSLEQAINAVAITFPDPGNNYETTEAETIVNSFEEGIDGRRLLQSLNLSACIYPWQCQRLAWSWIKDSRRFRVHRLTLPPQAAWVPPLSTIAWTSDHNGYTSKVFEIQQKQVNVFSLLTQVLVRERDSADYSFGSGDALPHVNPVNKVTTPDDYLLTGFTVAAVTDEGADGAKLVGVRITGLPDDIERFAYETRKTGDTAILSQGYAEASDLEPGTIKISAGLLRGTSMQVRIKVALDGAYAWSAWSTVTVDNQKSSVSDILVSDYTNFADGGDMENADALPFPIDSEMFFANSIFRSGTQSLAIPPTATTQTFYRTIKGKPGDKLAVSLWSYRNVSYDGTAAGNKIRFSRTDDSTFIEHVTFGVTDMPSASTWYERTGEITFPAGCTEITVELFVGDATAGNVFIDELEIRRQVDRAVIAQDAVGSDQIEKSAVTAVSGPSSTSSETTDAAGDISSKATGWHTLSGSLTSLDGAAIGDLVGLSWFAVVRRLTPSGSSGKYGIRLVGQYRITVGSTQTDWVDYGPTWEVDLDDYESIFGGATIPMVVADTIEARIGYQYFLVSGDDTALTTQTNLTQYLSKVSHVQK